MSDHAAFAAVDFTPPPPRDTRTVHSADGAALHVAEYGAPGAPAVVLVHGWTCSIAFWAPVIRALVADGHRVIAYDLRGHGASPAADPAGYGTRVLADDLCAVLEATLAPGERAVLGGHSMGAMTLMAAAEHQQLRARAAALMLCSTGGAELPAASRVFPLGPAWLRGWLHRTVLGSSLPMGPVTPVARSILKYATMSPGSAPERVDVCARIVHACPRRVRAAWGQVLSTLDLRHGLSRLTQPTAVVAGTADRLTPYVHARRMAAALPNCTGLTALTGLGHMTPVEAPEAITGVLTGLVRDHLTGEAAETKPATKAATKPATKPATKRATKASAKEESA